jgi:hypothetical protein
LLRIVAHVHVDPACLTLAQRRRAFGRALRVTGVLDIGQLAEAIAGATGWVESQDPGSS